MKLGKAEIIIIIVFVCLAVTLGVFLIKSTMPAQATANIPEPTITPIKPTGEFTIYSPKILIGNIPAGGIADDMTLNISNGYTDELTVTVEVVIPDRVTTDADTMLQYSPAPKDAQKWIVVRRFGEITVPPASIMSIPVRLTIPKDAKDLPERWEIDLRVSEGAGFLTRAYIQRYLITMR